MHLGLSADEVLTTTRAVRKRLDLDRPVDPALIRECLEIALQAPTGANRQLWHFVVVTDPATIAKLGELYRRATTIAKEQLSVLGRIQPTDQTYYDAQTARMFNSAEFLSEIIDRVPGMLIPCIEGNFAQQEVAQLLGIPYPTVSQVALIPFGHTLGTNFKPARREPLDRVLHWDNW